MANYLGEDYKILTPEIDSLVAALAYATRKEDAMAILTSVLAMTSNPAYQAALITALKSSGRLNTVKDEIKNPSFAIADYPSAVDNAPAKFTEPYQPNTEFVDETIAQTIPASSGSVSMKILNVKRGSSTLARIVTLA